MNFVLEELLLFKIRFVNLNRSRNQPFIFWCQRESCSETEGELHPTAWKHKPELKDSLVDMYKANPKVNEELKQRLPSPVKHHCSETTPQPGFSSQRSTPSISQSTSETETAENILKGQNLSLPPPPPPPPPDRSMEEGMLTPQRVPTGQGQDGKELDSRAPHTPDHCSTSEPAVSRGNTDEDHGSFKVNQETRKQVPFVDEEKNIAFLLKELDCLRDLNNKLQDKLMLKEKELETIRLDSQLQDEKFEAHACERAAALVEEIYKAQRERDQAVMARLRLANEERDEALLRAKKLQEAALELENINPEETDTDLEALLNKVSNAESALSVERNGMAIMELIQRARERRSRIISEEMKVVINERDNALTRCRRLEQELLVQTSCTCHLSTPSGQERVCKEELDGVQKERDFAVEHSHKLEDKMPSLHRFHSAQQNQADKSYIKETSISSSSTCVKDITTAPNQSLHSRVQQLTSELQTTQNQLRLALESESEAREKMQKLERLVEVLRKKVGTGNVRTVI
ncbi:mirror-image polydactyly gene 1 protein [Trichomycterus rosablanca]|uniref:mirror-image polydactyly gene 1 protein n=1 Tax=Trichomycterus rosablanca TaxID=2290929 RepID=UPI002F355BD4